MIIKFHLAEHQERSRKDDLSVIFTTPLWLSFQKFEVIQGLFGQCMVVTMIRSAFIIPDPCDKMVISKYDLITLQLTTE